MRRNRPEHRFDCSIEAAIGAIGGKWKSAILLHLSNEKKRFNELRRVMPVVTQRMLTKQLRELEDDGIIERQIYAEVPPKVEYSLTEFGISLLPVLKQLEIWGDLYLKKLKESCENL